MHCAACMQDMAGLWLVFHDEGSSLHSLMYSPAIAGPAHPTPNTQHAPSGAAPGVQRPGPTISMQ